MADFFDKVVDGFNKGVATVSAGSKTMLEKSRISSLINNVENEKKQLAEILGNKVYQLHINDPDGIIDKSEIEDICNQISARIKQVEEYMNKIAELDAEMSQIKGNQPLNGPAVCKCGSQNVPGSRFCSKCGNKLF